MSRAGDCEVAIIGAGPYGLSSAAYLGALGMDVRVFGEPMEFWARRTPPGMLLRSPREASTIADPRAQCTLEEYEAASGTAPEKRVRRDTFVAYGRWFERRVDAVIDPRGVVGLNRAGPGFRLTLADGTEVSSRRAVVATGVRAFKRSPGVFSHLSPCRVSHCYDGEPFDAMGRRVAVIGGGQSSLECAALLSEAGVSVEVIARISTLRWIGRHLWLHRLGPVSRALYSKYDVGPVGISRLVANPRLVSCIPLPLKDRIRTRAVRSAGAPWLIPRLGGVKLTTDRTVVTARECGCEVELLLNDGTRRRVDYVLLATGYRVDIARYDFLPGSLVQQIRQRDGYPEVGRGFTTSVPGLHFLGATASRNFGPLLCFVAGTDFASRELASWLRRRA